MTAVRPPRRTTRRSIPGLILLAGTVLAATIVLSAQVAPLAPSITIDSPIDGSMFYSHVALKGRIVGAPTRVESLQWSIDGTDRAGALDEAPDGSFSADVPLDDLHANLVLTVSARLDGKPRRVSVGLVDRRAGPSVYIQSPRRGTIYGSSMRIMGQVRGPVELEDPLGEVASLSWSVDGTSAGGPLPFRRDGVFDFSFSTVGLHGPVAVSVHGKDKNGHEAVATLRLQDRPTGPALSVDTPADKSSVDGAATVTVAGRVGDPADPSGVPAEVKTLSWHIVGDSSREGDVARQHDGTFSFSLPTQGLSGTQTLELRAEDRNGRVTTVSRILEGPAVAAASAAPLAPAPAVAVTPAAPAQTPHPSAPAVAPAPAGPPITISSPAPGGFYKDITIVEGKVAIVPGTELKSFAYAVPGHDKTGRVAADRLGVFKVPLDLSGISGDLSIVLSAEDPAGGRSETTLTLHDGRLKPAITVSAPSNNSSYGSAIRVAGTVTDPYAGMPGMAGIQSATWLLSPVTLGKTSTPARGTLALGEGGAFRLTLPTTGLSGAQDLTLTVASTNGNRADVTLRLNQGDSDLPSFKVDPGDGGATASWEPPPFVAHYELVWAPADAPLATGTTLSNVNVPARVTGLQNGAKYNLQVKATFDDGTTGTSPVTSFIPLSPQTLAPKASGDYQKIQLSWKGIPGAASFDVWRSSKHSALPHRVAAGVAGTSFADTDVEYGTDYSYKVVPASILAPMSAAATARSLAFPSEKFAALGRAAFEGARGTLLNGGYVFAASGSQGVNIVDVSTASSPVSVARIPTNDAWDTAVRGSYAYVADGESGLRVFDISEPRQPVEIGQRKTSSARAVVLSGKYAYVADGDKGIKVIDTSDAQELPRVGAVDTENAQGLALVDHWLYVADGTGGVKVFDLSRPTAPKLVETLPTTDARQISVDGNLAAVADGAGGLRVLDVREPAKPTVIATMNMKMAAAVALDSGFAYVADRSSGLTVVNLEDPAHPAPFATQPAAGASGVSVHDRVAYIADQAGLDVVRVQIIGRSFAVALVKATGRAYDVTVSGNWAYVAGHSDGIRMVDVSQPGEMNDDSLAGSVGSRFAQSVSVQDRFAYVADGTSGLRIVDMSPAWTKGGVPVTTASYRPGGTVKRAVPAGHLLYVAAGDRGLQVLDVSSPTAPTVVSSVRSTDASDVIIRDTWAFLADGSGGVRVVDMTDPASPVLLPAAIKVDAHRLALSGNLLVAAGGLGVAFIDVSNPRSPREESLYRTDSAQSVDARGNYVYVAEGYQGLTVLDAAQPAHPAVVSTCDSIYAQGVAVKGDYALVADSAGLRTVQILIPTWLQH